MWGSKGKGKHSPPFSGEVVKGCLGLTEQGQRLDVDSAGELNA